MPNIDAALIAFGKLIGLMDASGTVQWAWFADPLNKSLLGIPANRDAIGVLMRALLELPDAAADPVFDATGLVWQPVLSPSSPVNVGPVWNSSKIDPLHLGLGARASLPIAGQTIDLGVVARMLDFSLAGALTPEFGQVVFETNLPVPQTFLGDSKLSGSYTNALALQLDVNEHHWRIARVERSPQPHWCGMVRDWRRSWCGRGLQVRRPRSPSGDKSFFYKLDQHLFPMLGDPGTARSDKGFATPRSDGESAEIRSLEELDLYDGGRRAWSSDVPVALTRPDYGQRIS